MKLTTLILTLLLATPSSGSLPFSPTDAGQSGAPHGHGSVTSVRNLPSDAEHEPPVRYRHGAP